MINSQANILNSASVFSQTETYLYMNPSILPELKQDPIITNEFVTEIANARINESRFQP